MPTQTVLAGQVQVQPIQGGARLIVTTDQTTAYIIDLKQKTVDDLSAAARGIVVPTPGAAPNGEPLR